MASALLDAMPAGGYPAVPAGVLDSDTAWALVLEGRVGLRVSRPDASALLEWVIEPGSVERFQALPDAMRTGVRSWIGESTGGVGMAILDAARVVSGGDIVSLGLVCVSLFSRDGAVHPDPGARDAVIRFEPFIAGMGGMGGRPLVPRDGAAWADAALALVRQRGRGERHVRGWLDRADALMNDLGAGDAAWRSDVSPRGFEQRCERCAHVISKALDAAASAPPDLEPVKAIALLQAHRLATSDAQRDRVERLSMALRLVRWLRLDRTARPGSLADAARQHIEEDAFADWAKTTVRGGDPSPVVSALCTKVLTAVHAARDERDLEFADLLAGWLDADSTSDVLLTEQLLNDVVAPAAEAAPVLLLVVDGMSAAVFHELADSVLQEGWIPVTSGAHRAPQPVISLLPSITEYCRASLFAGAPQRGTGAAGQ